MLTESGPCLNGQVFLSQKSETPLRPSFKIFNIDFCDCFGFQSDLYSAYTSATCSLCVHPVFQNIFNFRPPLLCPLKAFLDFWHCMSSSRCCLQCLRFIDVKLACSSAVSFLDIKLDGLQILKTYIILTSLCGFHDEGPRT